MTAQQNSALRVGVLTTILAGVFLMALSKASEQVIFRSEFEVREANVDNKLDRILDMLCQHEYNQRACGE